MPQNTLMDLNNHMFETLERLNDDELDSETEIKRAKAVASIGKVIVDNAAVMLDAKKYADEYNTNVPEFMLGNEIKR